MIADTAISKIKFHFHFIKRTNDTPPALKSHFLIAMQGWGKKLWTHCMVYRITKTTVG